MPWISRHFNKNNELRIVTSKDIYDYENDFFYAREVKIPVGVCGHKTTIELDGGRSYTTTCEGTCYPIDSYKEYRICKICRNVSINLYEKIKACNLYLRNSKEKK